MEYEIVIKQKGKTMSLTMNETRLWLSSGNFSGIGRFEEVHIVKKGEKKIGSAH